MLEVAAGASQGSPLRPALRLHPDAAGHGGGKGNGPYRLQFRFPEIPVLWTGVLLTTFSNNIE